MPLKFTSRRPEDVPSARSNGRVKQDLVAIKNAMANLASGMVLEIETDGEKAVRGTKVLVTKAAKELGTQWQHWHAGASVYAKPVDAGKRRGRPRKSEQPA